MRKRLSNSIQVILMAVSVIFTCILFGPSPEAAAVNWQITGYSPQQVEAGKPEPAGAVTINGSFSTYQEHFQVKLGRGNMIVADVTPHVIVWTTGQIKLLMPADIEDDVYWLGIYASDPGGNLLVEGPENLAVVKKISANMPHLKPPCQGPDCNQIQAVVLPKDLPPEIIIDLDSCNLSVVTVDFPADHESSYRFEGLCKSYKSKSLTHGKTHLTNEYKPVHLTVDAGVGTDGSAAEKIAIHDFGTFFDIESRWYCNDDPWLSPWTGCPQEVPGSSHSIPGIDISTHKKGSKPFSIKMASAIQDYIQTQTPAPVLSVPELPYLDAQGLSIKVGYRRDDLYKFFQYPQEAKKIIFYWERWMPSPDGKSGWWQEIKVRREADLLSEDELTTIAIPALKLKEGKWRLSARHDVHPAWPWNEKVFWIGPPVDYTKLKPVIIFPAENAVLKHLEGSQDSFPLDILVQLGGNPKKGLGSSKAQTANPSQNIGMGGGQASEIEVEFNMSMQGKWGPSPPVFWVTQPNKKLSKVVHTGFYRIRARRRVENPGPNRPAYPWSDWRLCSAGSFIKPGALNPKGGDDKKTVKKFMAGKLKLGGSMKAMSGEAPVGPQGPGRQANDKAIVSQIAKQGQVAKLKEPKIVVTSIAAKPAPLTEGKPVTLIVSLRNKGRAGSKGASFKVKCTPPPGVEDCLVPDGPHSMAGTIQPGMMKSMRLHGAKPAAAGVYRVEVTPLPVNKKQRPVTATFTVLHKITPRKAPLLKTMPGAGGSLHKKGGGVQIRKPMGAAQPVKNTAPTLQPETTKTIPSQQQQQEEASPPALQPKKENTQKKGTFPQLKLHIQ